MTFKDLWVGLGPLLGAAVAWFANWIREERRANRETQARAIEFLRADRAAAREEMRAALADFVRLTEPQHVSSFQMGEDLARAYSQVILTASLETARAAAEVWTAANRLCDRPSSGSMENLAAVRVEFVNQARADLLDPLRRREARLLDPAAGHPVAESVRNNVTDADVLWNVDA